MNRSELIARLMRCDPAHTKNRSLPALASEIETRTRGDEAATLAELKRLGFDDKRLFFSAAIRNR